MHFRLDTGFAVFDWCTVTIKGKSFNNAVSDKVFEHGFRDMTKL